MSSPNADLASDEYLDRAAQRRSDLEFLEAKLQDPSSLLVPFYRDLHPVKDGALVLPDLEHAEDLLDAQGELVWLGLLGERACFGVDIGKLAAPLDHPALRGAELLDLRLHSARLSTAQLELAYYARALLGWHARHAFCAVCGQPSRPRSGGHVRLCSRDSCAAEHFPRVDPCVLVLVTDRNREHCLLGRQAAWPRGMYSTLAGFVEPGETLEHAVAREVLEESGVSVGEIQYSGSQPWPFPSSLMLGFVARADAERLPAPKLDDELEDARWFSRAELAEILARTPTDSPGILVANSSGIFVPGPRTIAGQLIRQFVAFAPDTRERT